MREIFFYIFFLNYYAQSFVFSVLNVPTLGILDSKTFSMHSLNKITTYANNQQRSSLLLPLFHIMKNFFIQERFSRLFINILFQNSNNKIKEEK